MEVRPGYKQTEVGLIPEDWCVKTIAEIGAVGRGRVISHKEIARSLSPTYPVYSSQTKDDGVMGYLDTFEFEGEYITWTTDGANAGTVFARTGRFNCTNVCGTIRLKSDDHHFVAKVLGGIAPRHVSRHLGNPKLMNDVMKRILVPLPPLPEQRAIAAALSDVDALLGGLDRLIAKKRDLKQAAMQQLLTGQTRLPGFHGEWGTLNMAQKSLLKARIGWQGLTTAEYLQSGTYYLVTGTDFSAGRVNWEKCPFVAAERYEQDHNIQLQTNDVLVTKDGTIGKVAFVNECPGPATLNSGVFVIRPKGDSYSPQFLYYILASDVFEEFLRKLVAGSTISHLYQKDFVSFEFYAPQSVEEQTAIAAVLSDMGAELAALEARRDKTRALKQGMMQELLTGRTRLV